MDHERVYRYWTGGRLTDNQEVVVWILDVTATDGIRAVAGSGAGLQGRDQVSPCLPTQRTLGLLGRGPSRVR
jgi:hypothetical protein